MLCAANFLDVSWLCALQARRRFIDQYMAHVLINKLSREPRSGEKSAKLA
jgi:hypothetical protein